MSFVPLWMEPYGIILPSSKLISCQEKNERLITYAEISIQNTNPEILKLVNIPLEFIQTLRLFPRNVENGYLQ